MMTADITETTEQYWTWRDIPIHYVRAGGNTQQPPLLLVHGFGASTDHWRKNIADLSREFEVWAIDLVGFGRSAKPAWSYSSDMWRDQLHDFIAEVVKRPVAIAGNSLGGYAALCLAADRPESVAGVILLNSAGPFTDTNPLGAQQIHPVQKTLRGVAQKLFKQSWVSFLLFQYARQRSQIRRVLMQVYVNRDAVTDRLVEDIYRPSTDPGAVGVFAAIFSTPPGRPVDCLLAQMHCPLMTIWGEADPWMNGRARGDKFRQYYPGLTEHYIHAGHCPHDDAPEIVNALMRQWVASNF